MHIVHIASELAPVAKVGGLADMVLGLARETQSRGHQVTFLLPNYDCLLRRHVENMEKVVGAFTCFYEGENRAFEVWKGTVNGLPVLLIGDYAPMAYFNRGVVYGASDDIDRFIYFSKAALEALHFLDIRPDVLHCHDWPTALVGPLLRDQFHDSTLSHAKVVLTLHNLDYQGRCSVDNLNRAGVEGHIYQSPDKMGDNTWPEAINLVKGGIVYSDAFTTVSPTYSEEVRSPSEGRGLENTINRHHEKFRGILNGIDYTYWNPADDSHLTHHYTVEDLETHDTTGKDAAKTALRARLNLEECPRPIVSCVSRLVPQKGVELMKHALYRTRELGGQFVLLGSSPDASLQAQFEELRSEFAEDPHVHLVLRSSEELAHQIYAGSDMLLIPSLFEPCGLTQMIALHYGTVPLVRLVGGLADTVFDIETAQVTEELRNGFTFEHATPEGVNWALDRAIACWRERPQIWHQTVVRGMRQDHSWSQRASEYIQLYEDALSRSEPVPIG